MVRVYGVRLPCECGNRLWWYRLSPYVVCDTCPAKYELPEQPHTIAKVMHATGVSFDVIKGHIAAHLGPVEYRP